MEKLKRFVLMLGPGILWATIAIGETHLALMPYAGALFGMNLLWAVLLVHIFYYPNFEFGPRYAVATGESLIDGYGRIKLGKVFYWFFLALMFVTPPLMMGYILGGLMETSLVQLLILSEGSLLPLVTRPISLVFVLLTGFFVLWSTVFQKRRRKSQDS